MAVSLHTYYQPPSFELLDDTTMRGVDYLKKLSQKLGGRKCSQQIHHWGNNPLNSRQVRMLASVGFESEQEVGKQLMKLFFPGQRFRGTWQQFLGTPLKNIPAKNIDSVFVFYGLDGKHPHLTSIKDLIDWILKVKRSGLTIKESLTAMSYMLHQFLENGEKLSKRGKQVIESFEEDVCFNLKLEGLRSQLNYYVDMKMFKDVERVLDKLATIYMERAEKFQGQVVGCLIPAGWQGHLIVMEIRKMDSKYVVTLSQVGGEVDSPLGPDKKMQAVHAFVVEDAREMKERLKDMLYLKCVPFETFDKGIDYCYGVFKDCVEVPLEKLPKRPVQNIGNCGIRSFLEMFIWTLQRAGEHDLATHFLKHVNAFCRQHIFDFPAFEVAFRPRGAIEPLNFVRLPSYVLA